MSVLFEITNGCIKAGLEGETRTADAEQFIADAFAKIGRKIEHNGITYTITRIIKFDI